MNIKSVADIYFRILKYKQNIQYNKNDDTYSLVGYYISGKLHYEYKYKNGKRHGKSTVYWENGIVVNEHIYENGMLKNYRWNGAWNK